jgi:nucleotide-binding universal stress UspA family protein
MGELRATTADDSAEEAPRSGRRLPRAIVATDGSEGAIEAARRALELLRGDTEITLVTVMPETLWPEDTAGGLEGPLLSEEEARDRASADAAAADTALADTARAAAIVDAERVRVTGEAGPALCQLAEDMQADVLVVGSENKGVLRRVLVGSASRYVVDHAPCPVLVVRHGDHT